MASLHAISPHRSLLLSKPRKTSSKTFQSFHFLGPQKSVCSRNKEKTDKDWALNAAVRDELDVLPVQSGDSTDRQEGVVVSQVEREGIELAATQLSFEGFSSACSSSGVGETRHGDLEMEKLIDRTIDAMIVLAAGTCAITKLLTIDREYWHGWTLYEILRYAPQHNWSAYEEALKTNPVFAKMTISGVAYSLGDWIAQCYEGKPLLEFDRARMFRSGFVGFTLHGSPFHITTTSFKFLPFQDWWVVPAKVAFDQTAWAAAWNSIYFTILGFLRFESPVSIFTEFKATFWLMLTAGWKLWPFAHLITYGVIPVEERLLWVDCVELIWVTILSTYSNEKSEARACEAPSETSSSTQPQGVSEE
ncbi:hypothetical protein K2173_007760 [Erythroxylum novogranatense]|uniref:Peroxisomal membrane protein n=1 Tax=Erythroxylum novogranatense TaxID=1862640 RepID=A0AAV8TD32_9ROSI|nr:hypothetical protein K2173_007760 [Erythroxylum novogranatense]